MRVRLLNDGGYGDMCDLNFPVEVEATNFDGAYGVIVTYAEIMRSGAKSVIWDREGELYFSEYEFEVIE